MLNAPDIILLAVEEVAIGLVIGLLSTVIFDGLQLAGQIASQQIGFAMANVVDPLSNLNRITSYNVCYTKLLRQRGFQANSKIISTSDEIV